MNTAAQTMTEIAREGYDGNDNRHLASSPHFYAHALGRFLHDTGRSPPRDVRMSRGYSIRANDLLFKITHNKGNSIAFERVS